MSVRERPTVVSRISRRLWQHVATFPKRPLWQRCVFHAVWFGLAILAALWILKLDCPIC
jgi:hypothetical protein